MEQLWSKARFIVIHMLQVEVLLSLLIASLLLWVLNRQLLSYSTKSKEAALCRLMALGFLGVIGGLVVLGRILR